MQFTLICVIIYLTLVVKNEGCIFRKWFIFNSSPAYRTEIIPEPFPDCDCGERKHGKPKWILYITIDSKASGKTCIGTIITSNLIATSEDCVHLNIYKWNVWGVSRSQIIVTSEPNGSGERFIVEELVSGANNLVLLKVKADFTSHPEHSPICIPEGQIDFTNYQMGYYGQSYIKGVGVAKEECGVYLESDSLCLKWTEENKLEFGSGPLVIESEGGKAFLVGIMDGFHSKKDAVFINILPSVNYLKSTADKHQSKWCGISALKPKKIEEEAETCEPVTPKGKETSKGLKFRIGIVADLDKDSYDTSSGKPQWISYLREGDLYLDLNEKKPRAKVRWDISHKITTDLSNPQQRGMELSTLNMFKGRLLACDDKTGIIYELKRESGKISAIPWVTLESDSGSGFKCEWAAVKGCDLYVGAHGHTVIDKGQIKSEKIVKKISANGEVTTLNWKRKYKKLERSLGVIFPGYVTHEAVGWSWQMNKWMFLPRYISRKRYDKETTSQFTSNVFLTTDEKFGKIRAKSVGEKGHGFSSFKWIPGTNDELIVALKTVEIKPITETFIIVFDINGRVLLPETKIVDQKFEGIEFI